MIFFILLLFLLDVTSQGFRALLTHNYEKTGESTDRPEAQRQHYSAFVQEWFERLLVSAF